MSSSYLFYELILSLDESVESVSVRRFASGQEYKGYVENGQPHGLGTMKYQENSYVGKSADCFLLIVSSKQSERLLNTGMCLPCKLRIRIEWRVISLEELLCVTKESQN